MLTSLAVLQEQPKTERTGRQANKNVFPFWIQKKGLDSEATGGRQAIKEAWRPWYVGKRIGEASHPGPDVKEQGERQGMTCMTVNTTSLDTQEEWLASRTEEVILVQETRLTGNKLEGAV